MVLSLSISEEAEATLTAKARAAGVDLPTYVANIVEETAKRPLSLSEINAKTANDSPPSRLNDDELADFLEEVKHEVRAQLRCNPKSP